MKSKLPLEAAQRLAAALIEQLAPGCHRIEVAGSIRRRQPTVGDVELLAIPRRAMDLFGAPLPETMLDGILQSLCDAGKLNAEKGGDKFKQYRLVKADCPLDLFLVTAETWGCQMVIRTGPALFSRQIVTQRSKGGWCPDELSFFQGRLQRDSGGQLETPEEKDVFEALGMKFLEPWERGGVK